MELFGRQLPLLYIFFIPYIPFIIFLLILFSPVIFIWIIADLITNFSLGFFSIFNMIMDIILPPVKSCPSSSALSGGKRK